MKNCRTVAVLLCGGLFIAGCRGGAPATRPDHQTRDPYVIDAKELIATERTTLYDAIRQVRPFWFRREEGLLVYLDNQQIGTVATLRRFTPQSVARVRYLTATEAQVRFGQQNDLKPAVLLETSRAPSGSPTPVQREGPTRHAGGPFATSGMSMLTRPCRAPSPRARGCSAPAGSRPRS